MVKKVTAKKKNGAKKKPVNAFRDEEMVIFGEIKYDSALPFCGKAKMVVVGDKSVALLFPVDPDLVEAARTPEGDLRPDMAQAIDDHLVELAKAGMHYPMIEILLDSWDKSADDGVWGVSLGYTLAEKSDPIYRVMMIEAPKELQKEYKKTIQRFMKFTTDEHIMMEFGKG